jgi:tRNA A37 threonylcarbamoyltransferase TsaD
MALILNIETSTEVCSVALAENGTSVQTLENLSGQNHAMLVTVYIQEILAAQGLTINQLDALAVSGGLVLIPDYVLVLLQPKGFVTLRDYRSLLLHH